MFYYLCACGCNGGSASVIEDILADTNSAIAFVVTVFSVLADQFKFSKWRKAQPADQAAAKTTPADLKKNKQNDSNQRMTNKEAKKQAKKLGYDREVKDPLLKKGAHGNKFFTNGKNFITADRDVHSGGAWKMFDSSWNRIGTYDIDLNRIGK
jgi:hypothetical protein